MKNEANLNNAWEELEKDHWSYYGADFWVDPITLIKYPTSNAFEIMLQRRHNKEKNKLILCTDWMEIQKELRKQLKPYKLTVSFKTRKIDDQIKIEVKPL